MTVELMGSLAAHAGLSGQSIGTDQSAGGYAFGGNTWRLRPLTALDVGGRLGVTRGTPSYGLIGGSSIALIARRQARWCYQATSDVGMAKAPPIAST